MRTLTEELYDNEFYALHKLNEMSTISRDVDKLPRNTKIRIYGENDEPGNKTPHMHIVIDNGEIELEVKLQHIKNMEIWRTKRNYPKSWNGITNVRDAIIKWLDKPNSRRPSMLNSERVVDAWNDENPTNEITDKFLL